jgi:hypothetical protein
MLTRFLVVTHLAENRIGEQFELFADRASSATMMANQLRMWFSAMAYVLLDSLRRIGLRHTQFADAAVATIRLKLLKLDAQVRSSVRRLHSRSHQAARARSNSKWPIFICGGPSTLPEPLGLAKTKYVLPLRATTRVRHDSHCGKPHATGLAIREPQTTALRSDPICPLSSKKTAIAGFMRRHKMMEFEKSRLPLTSGEAPRRLQIPRKDLASFRSCPKICRRLGSLLGRRQRTKSPAVALPAPVRQGRRVQAFPAQDRSDPTNVGRAVGLRQSTQLRLRCKSPPPWLIQQFGAAIAGADTAVGLRPPSASIPAAPFVFASLLGMTM